MIILTATTDSLTVKLDGTVATNQLPCISSWRDITTTTYTPGRTVLNTNNVTPVTVVASPGSNHQIVVDFINIQNADTVTRIVTVSYDLNGTYYTIYNVTLQAGESVQYTDDSGWVHFNTAGTEMVNTSGPADTQVFIAAGSFTWTKPTTFTPTFVRVVAYGAGGGGGGGASATGALVRTGGSGGGGGCRVDAIYRAADLSSTATVVVGTGGTFGTAGAAGGGAGGDGGIGGSSTFSTGTLLLTAYGGGGGKKGDNSALAGAGGSGAGTLAAGAVGTVAAATGGAPGAPATPNGGCGANSLATAGTPVCVEYEIGRAHV